MIIRAVLTGLVSTFWYLCYDFTKLYIINLKASVAVQQLQDSNAVTAASRWFTGDMLLTVLTLLACALLMMIWYRPIHNLYKKENTQ